VPFIDTVERCIHFFYLERKSVLCIVHVKSWCSECHCKEEND